MLSRYLIYITYLLVIIALSSINSIAQSNAKFKHLADETDWWNSTITDMVQDEDGYLWITSWSGLFRYDGYNIKKYYQSPTEENQLRTNKISCLFRDSQNNLWIGTNYTGFYKYLPAIDGFQQYAKDPNELNSLSNDNVWAITEDEYGFLWIGTEKGLNRFDPKTGHFLHFEHNAGDIRSLSHDFVYSLSIDGQNNLWIGCETGLNRLVREENGTPNYFINFDLSPKDVSTDDYLRHNFIYKIISSVEAKNTLWIGTSIGLKKVTYSNNNLATIDYQHYYQGQKAFDNQLSHRFVSDIEEVKGGLWVSTYNGLNYFDKTKETFAHFFYDKDKEGSLDNNVVRNLYKDHFGSLWISTERGLNQLNLNIKGFTYLSLQDQKNTDNSLISSTISAKTTNGIWVATNGGGLKLIQLQQPYSNSQIKSYQLKTAQVSELANFHSNLIMDRHNNLWISTHGAGVLKIPEETILKASNQVTIPTQFNKENYLSDDYVMSLHEGMDGAIWMGYWSDGLSRYEPNTQQFEHFTHSQNLEVDLSKFPVIKIHETQYNGEHSLWIGTRGGGLFQLNYDTISNELALVQAFNSEQGNIGNNFINDIHQNNPEHLWIATDNGLNKIYLADNTIQLYAKKDGLLNRNALSIITDKENNLWISSGSNLATLNKLDEVQMIDQFDGLSDDFFMAQSGLKLSDGYLSFGGLTGLNIFNPKQISDDSIPPKVHLTDFHLFNQQVKIGEIINDKKILEKDISVTNQLDLSYKENVISFEFVGLQFNKPEKIQYAYQLEGFDENWVYTDAYHRIAHYTNLPYEDFVFKVKAANADGVWSETTTLNLTVHPPFWLTNGAYTIYTCLFLGLLYGVRRITNIRAEYRHNLQLEKLEKQQMQVINQAKLKFFTNISHELKTPLTLIVSPLEQLLRERQGNKQQQKVFTRMYHNANRLLTMINQLLDIRKSEAGLMQLKVREGNIVKFIGESILAFKGLANQQEIKLTLEMDKETIPLWYDRDQLEKVFFNLLSNALKFTPKGGEIAVTIKDDLENNRVVIQVKDTGNGIPTNHLPYIFDRFYQVENSDKNTIIQGAGIGLALTKSIVDLHKGFIEVKSEESVGTTFLITLQKGATHFTKESKIPNFKNSEQLSNYVKSDISEEGTPLAAKLTIVPLKTNKEKPTLLIVEDNSDIRSYLKENLQEKYKVLEAEDGKVGLIKATNNSPDLVIADILMPNMDGIELCRQLKSTIHTSHIPVILLTARTSLLFKIDGLETGADDYITKPFNMRLLLARVNNLIDSRAKLRQQFSNNFDLSPTGIPLNNLDEKLLNQVKRIIEKHIDDASFSVDDLAKGVLMSRMQLYRKLKALTGQPPTKIIRTIRLKRAAQLLETKQYNVADVTYMVGYNDLKSFREQFRKEYGVNPGGYG